MKAFVPFLFLGVLSSATFAQSFNCQYQSNNDVCLDPSEILIQGFGRDYCEQNSKYTKELMKLAGVQMAEISECQITEYEKNDHCFGNDKWAFKLKTNEKIHNLKIQATLIDKIKGVNCELLQHQAVKKLHEENALVVQVTPCLGNDIVEGYIRYLPDRANIKTKTISAQLENVLLAQAYMDLGKIDELKSMVKAGLNVNLFGGFGENLWRTFLHSGDHQDFDFLIENGFNVKEPKIMLSTLRMRDNEVLEKLLNAGAPLNTGCSYISMALNFNYDKNESLKMAKTLVKAGENPFTLDPYDHWENALYVAKDEKQLKYLLELGLPVNIKNKKQVSPLANVLRTKPTAAAMIDLLIAYGADVNQAEINIDDFLKERNSKKIEITKALINAGYKIDHKINPLVLTADNYDLSKFLLEKGFDPNKAHDDMLGTTPLIAAIHAGAAEVIKLLMENGANKYQSYTYENYFKEYPSRILEDHMFPTPYALAKNKGLPLEILDLLRLPNCEYIVESELDLKMNNKVQKKLNLVMNEKGYFTNDNSLSENDYNYIFNFKQKDQKISLTITDRATNQVIDFDSSNQVIKSKKMKTYLNQLIKNIPSCQSTK